MCSTRYLGHTQTPSDTVQDTTANTMVVNRPRTSSPVNHQPRGHTQKYDEYSDNYGHGVNGTQQSDKYVNDPSRHLTSFQTPHISSRSQSQNTPRMTSSTRLEQQQQHRHEPVSLLYQDLDDDVVDDEGALLTTVGTMETSYLSEKSEKDGQLTHFIETVCRENICARSTISRSVLCHV